MGPIVVDLKLSARLIHLVRGPSLRRWRVFARCLTILQARERKQTNPPKKSKLEAIKGQQFQNYDKGRVLTSHVLQLNQSTVQRASLVVCVFLLLSFFPPTKGTAGNPTPRKWVTSRWKAFNSPKKANRPVVVSPYSSEGQAGVHIGKTAFKSKST